MSYVTQVAFTGTVQSLLKIIEDGHNDLINEIHGVAAKQSQLFTRVGRVEARLDDPVYGLNAINAGLSRAYQDVTTIRAQINQVTEEIYQTQVALYNSGALAINPRSGALQTPQPEAEPFQWPDLSGVFGGLAAGFGGFGVGVIAVLGLGAILLLRSGKK